VAVCLYQPQIGREALAEISVNKRSQFSLVNVQGRDFLISKKQITIFFPICLSPLKVRSANSEWKAFVFASRNKVLDGGVSFVSMDCFGFLLVKKERD